MKNKGEKMNNFKKIGVSALAGSLVAFSAHAADLAVTGTTAISYTNQDTSEVTGNPMGMKTNIGFATSGDLDNGWGISYFITMADNFTGTSSAKLTVDMGDMGSLAFDQGSGSGIDAYDDVMPTANEEVWDGLDTSGSGLTGSMNSDGTFNYKNTISGVVVNGAFRIGSAADSADGVTSGDGAGGGYSVVLAADESLTGTPGLDVGVGYGAQDAGTSTEAAHDSRDTEDFTVFAKYAYGPVTVGYQRNHISAGEKGVASQEADIFGIAFNVNDNFAVSYGEKETEFLNSSSVHTTEKVDGFGVSYTMGSMKVAGNRNSGSAMGGVTGTNDQDTEIVLSFAF